MLNRRDFVHGSLALGAVATAAIARAAERVGSPVDGLGRRLVAAINSPNTDRASLATLFTPQALIDQSDKDWLADFAAIRRVSGGLEYLGTTQTSRDLLVMVRTRLGGLERLLTAYVKPDSRSQLSGYNTLPRPAPYPKMIPSLPMTRGELGRAIGERVAWSAKRDEFSGAVRVVAPDGAVVHQSAHGTSEARLIDASDRFHLGSADKSFTALMVAKHVRTGRLRFDTRLSEVLPDYPNARAAQAITVEHLLSHRSGLGALFDRKQWDKDKPYARVSDLLPVFASEPLFFEPGQRWSYSNEGFVVLGAVLERIEGRPYWDLLAEHIYRPGGMSRSAHLTAAEVVTDRVIGARYADDDLLGMRGRVSAKNFTGWRGNSCGGGYSTVADMCNYLRALRAGVLLEPALVARLIAPYPGGRPDYGMGFQCRERDGRRLIGHAGGGPHSGIDGDSAIIWDTGWAWSVLGNFDAPFAGALSYDIGTMLAAQPSA